MASDFTYGTITADFSGLNERLESVSRSFEDLGRSFAGLGNRVDGMWTMMTVDSSMVTALQQLRPRSARRRRPQQAIPPTADCAADNKSRHRRERLRAVAIFNCTSITVTSYPFIYDNDIGESAEDKAFVEHGMVPLTFLGYGVYDDPSARPPMLAALETSRTIVV